MVISTISAGGVVLREEQNETQIIIVELENNVPEKWAPVLRQLPKGGCKQYESIEETASREVLEETGYSCTIIRKAGEANWSYERNGQQWDETVHYFFMRLKSDIALEHDDEFDRVRWININKAANILSYPEERELIKKIINYSLLEKLSEHGC